MPGSSRITGEPGSSPRSGLCCVLETMEGPWLIMGEANLGPTTTEVGGPGCLLATPDNLLVNGPEVTVLGYIVALQWGAGEDLSWCILAFPPPSWHSLKNLRGPCRFLAVDPAF
jgi:hypothetical protein